MNNRFSALITKEEDDWHVARCHELSVTSQGTDVESARANLREAIELYHEGTLADMLKQWATSH